jgi:hypothetical protein
MAAYNLIATTTVGSGGAASIDFTGIPATYTDLQILASIRTDEANTFSYLFIKFNNNTTSYSQRMLFGNGSGTGSSTFATTQTVDINAASNTASVFTNLSVYIPNYAGGNNKSFSIDSAHEQNGTSAYGEMTANLWSNTSAINQVTFYLSGSFKFVEYSSASLYGIKNS